jgi:hypothetical protein
MGLPRSDFVFTEIDCRRDRLLEPNVRRTFFSIRSVSLRLVSCPS